MATPPPGASAGWRALSAEVWGTGHEFEAQSARAPRRRGEVASEEDDELFRRAMLELGIRPARSAERAHDGADPDRARAEHAPGPLAASRVDDEADDDAMRRVALASAEAYAPASGSDAEEREGWRRLTSQRGLLRGLRSGAITVEDELDLHGCKREEARRLLSAFLRAKRSEGLGVVRIICGQGHGSRDRAVLREAVPRWVGADHDEDVLRLLSAPTELGGRGALIAFLRRPTR